MRPFAVSVGTIVAMLLAAACGDDEGEPARCTPGELRFTDLQDGQTPRIAVGAEFAVEAGRAAGASSADERLAAASVEEGEVRVVARAPGQVRIDAEGSCGERASFDVEVVAVDRFELRPMVREPLPLGPVGMPPARLPAGVALAPGGTLLLLAVPLDADGAALEGALAPAWTTSDPTVAVAPFGPPGDGLATVSWYDGHAPVNVFAGGSGLEVAFSAGEPAAALAFAHDHVFEPIDRLELSPRDGADVAVLAYDADGRLLLGPDSGVPTAASGNEEVLLVGLPGLQDGSGIPSFGVSPVSPGTTTVEFHARGTTGTLEVKVKVQ